jgi:putative hydrolase of the HAD superfamily
MPSASKIRAVILDYGDVISLPRDPAIIRWMAELLHLPETRFLELYGAFRHDYDRGALLPHEYWGKIGESAGMALSSEQIEQLRTSDVAMWSRLNHKILGWADRLREAGYKVGVLSNMHIDMVEHLKANGEWTRRFDGLTLSAPLGVAKPEPEIFKHCLKLLDVRPDEALFVDDREPNITAAEAVGITGILAATPTQLRQNLEAMGFAPLPEV